jgi:hypothetical protein
MMPTPELIKKAVAWYDAARLETLGYDFFGRLYWLNGIRPVTRWRHLRTKLGFRERDTLRAPLGCNPMILDMHRHPVLRFDGRQVMRSRTWSSTDTPSPTF